MATLPLHGQLVFVGSGGLTRNEVARRRPAGSDGQQAADTGQKAVYDDPHRQTVQEERRNGARFNGYRSLFFL